MLDPHNSGTVTTQISAGTMPPTSPLFVMPIAYDAYLGLYIGEPESVDRSGSAPQQYYATKDLGSQQWTLIGDTGAYHTASWYRWMVDTGSGTVTDEVVGKTLRAYCGIACSGGSGGEYATLTINSSAPAGPPVDLSKTYTVGNGAGRVLAQVASSTATTSDAAPTGSSLESWSFIADGDGSYQIRNAGTGQDLGVDSTADAGRAWGAAPTATTVASGGPTVGRQWWLIADSSPAGTVRIVNRYSDLMLALSSVSTRLTETTPDRGWSNTTGNAVGGTRTAAEQTLTLAVANPVNPVLNGAHTVTASGQALDDPGHSQSAGTQLITWSPNGGGNQNWVVTQQGDGSYQIVNGESNLCMDDDGGFTTPGTAVIQYPTAPW